MDSPGYPDLPHPLSYYYIGFPEKTEEASSSYTRNYGESSDRLLSLPTPITPNFYSYGNSYSPCGQSRLPQEYEGYPQSQFSKSVQPKLIDYFQKNS
jgi:hypothetical protein